MTNQPGPTTASEKRRLRAAIAIYIAWVGILVALVAVSSDKPPENPASAPSR